MIGKIVLEDQSSNWELQVMDMTRLKISSNWWELAHPKTLMVYKIEPNLSSSTKCQLNPCLACMVYHLSQLVQSRATKDRWFNKLFTTTDQETFFSVVETTTLNLTTYRTSATQGVPKAIILRQWARHTRLQSSSNKRGKNWKTCIGIWKSSITSPRMKMCDSELEASNWTSTWPRRKKTLKTWQDSYSSRLTTSKQEADYQSVRRLTTWSPSLCSNWRNKTETSSRSARRRTERSTSWREM